MSHLHCSSQQALDTWKLSVTWWRKELRSLPPHNQDEDHPEYHGLTPLHGTFFAHFGAKSTTGGIEKRFLKILIFLLEAGANPSALPFDGTPMWKKSFCSVEATRALVNHGMDLNQRFTSPSKPDFFIYKNISILHLWAGLSFGHQADSVAMVKLLLEKGVDIVLKDDDGFTPLLRAAYGNGGYFPNLGVLDFFLERDNFSRMEKIEAMELAGAVIFGDSGRASRIPNAAYYWRRAHQLRQVEKEGTSKIPLQRDSGGTVEWVTSEDLERVIQNPSEYKIQAFLVALRILSQKSSGALDSLLKSQALRNFRKELTDQSGFIKLVHLSWATLEALARFDKDDGLSYHVFRTTEDLLEALSKLERDSPNLLTDQIIER